MIFEAHIAVDAGRRARYTSRLESRRYAQLCEHALHASSQLEVLNPPPSFGDAAMLAKGNEKYNQLCTVCHEARLVVPVVLRARAPLEVPYRAAAERWVPGLPALVERGTAVLAELELVQPIHGRPSSAAAWAYTLTAQAHRPPPLPTGPLTIRRSRRCSCISRTRTTA